MAEKYIPMPFPSAGIDVTMETHQQRAGTTPDATNVRLRESIHKRLRGGSRPGLEKYVPAAITGAGLIQSLETVVRTDGQAISDNAYLPEREKFHANDRSTPSQTGWTYIEWADDTSTLTTDLAYALTNPSTTNNRIVDPKKIPPEGTGTQPTAKPKKMRVKIKWDQPADIRIPTPLNGTQLNAVARSPVDGEIVPGEFAYTPDKLTVLAVGNNRPLRTVFNPTNLEKWIPTPASTQINVLDYTNGTTEVDGKVFPNTLSVTYIWGDHTWGTTATKTYSDATTIYWEIQNLPHTFVNICDDDPAGQIVLRKYDLGTGSLIYYQTGIRTVEWAANLPLETPAEQETPTATTDVPVNWAATLRSNLGLQRAGGAVEINDLTILVTGP